MAYNAAYDTKLNDISQLFFNPFGFVGYQSDNITDLHYAQARFYKPRQGRFISEDILSGEKLMPQSLNRYVYCWNQPLDYFDLDGLCRQCASLYMERYGSEYRNRYFPYWSRNCANFVSQVLFVGGLDMRDDWRISSADSLIPNFALNLGTITLRSLPFVPVPSNLAFNDESLNNRPVFVTDTWNNADAQFRFFTDPNNGFINGRVIEVNRESDLARIVQNNNIRIGDLLHMDFNGDGRINHATVISNVSSTNLYLAGNTANWHDECLAEWMRNNFYSRPNFVLHITMLNDTVFRFDSEVCPH